ncbi:MAG: hypothetical protein HQK49_18080 [Oligoflexia bacterium]|nr:hypothetical protein [Oligoflexia bacterium]
MKKKNNIFSYLPYIVLFSILMGIFFFSILDIFKIFKQLQIAKDEDEVLQPISGSGSGSGSGGNSTVNAPNVNINGSVNTNTLNTIPTKDFNLKDKISSTINKNERDFQKNKREKKEKNIIRYGRRVLGFGVHNLKNSEHKLYMVNNYNEEWLDKLRVELRNLYFNNNNNINYSIEVDDSFIQLDSNGLGRFVERVIISTTTPEGITNSFNAKIDSETGKILESWHPNIFEFNHHKPKIRASGML